MLAACSLQIRVRSQYYALWSNPKTQRVNIEQMRPAKVGDEEFDITSFKYRLVCKSCKSLIATIIIVYDHVCIYAAHKG